MNSAKLNDWVQGIGIFALVASLIFVGIEVRQNSIATRSATNAAVKNLGTGTVDDAERRGRHMRWAWESERVIFNQDFQIFVDGILSIER